MADFNSLSDLFYQDEHHEFDRLNTSHLERAIKSQKREIKQLKSQHKLRDHNQLSVIESLKKQIELLQKENKRLSNDDKINKLIINNLKDKKSKVEINMKSKDNKVELLTQRLSIMRNNNYAQMRTNTELINKLTIKNQEIVTLQCRLRPYEQQFVVCKYDRFITLKQQTNMDVINTSYVDELMLFIIGMVKSRWNG